MGEMKDTDGTFEMASKVQHYGVLSKKPFGHPSNKWSKRFFVVKDGYLLYYQDNERKDFEKRRYFNVHPKGSIPLGSCTIEPNKEPGHPFSIQINSDELNGSYVLAAESEFERDKWLNILNQSCRVTWKSVELGDTIIHQLENQGLQMMEEKQQYYDKLQNEAMALHDEKLKTEELERVKEELEEEKSRMESLANELKAEYERLKVDMEDATNAMQTVEEEKDSLHQNAAELQSLLESLESEKKKITDELSQRKTETLKLSQEKETLSAASLSLQDTLEDIENKTQQLLCEKREFEERLREQEEKAALLEEEKAAINEHAQQLQASIKDISQQKAVTEAELKEEVEARLEAEGRLREAEASLARLEKAVNRQVTTTIAVAAAATETGSKTEKSEVVDKEELDKAQEEMIADVRTLKHFFENLAFESKIEAEKTLMIKTAIHHRKSCVRRAHTLRYDAARKRKLKSRDYFSPSTTGFLNATVIGAMPLTTASAFDLTEIGGSPLSPQGRMTQFRHSSFDLPTDFRLSGIDEDCV